MSNFKWTLAPKSHSQNKQGYGVNIHLKFYFCLILAEGHNKCSFQGLIHDDCTEVLPHTEESEVLHYGCLYAMHYLREVLKFCLCEAFRNIGENVVILMCMVLRSRFLDHTQNMTEK